MKKIVIAIGGNAILQSDQKGTIAEQQENITLCCGMIADLVEEGYHVVVTHGNGPQVGSIVIQNDIAKTVVPENPLDVCGAQTQGSLGYLISQTLSNVFKKRQIDKQVASVLTQVLVDAQDQSFNNPTKFIGPFFGQEDAKLLEEQKGFVMREDSGRGYRRVVPSPKPIELIEKNVVRTLFMEGYVVITVGGGGIPVVKKGEELAGIEAVIDKDFASALVAENVDADALIILTGVSKVCVDYGTENQRALDTMSIKECEQYIKEGQFPAGSMGPKIEAALDFVKSGKGEAIITSIDNMKLALEGKEGTRITK